MSTMESRLKGLLWGSFAGDALALCAHWIYDDGKIRDRFGTIARYADPKGAAVTYHGDKRAGDFTHYGDQTLCLLTSLSEKGGWEADDFLDKWTALFRGESTPYVDKATKDTLRNLDGGVPSTRAGSLSRDMGGAARFAPVMALLAERPLEERIGVAKAQAALTHRGPGVDECAEFGCRAVDAALHGAGVEESLRHAASAEYTELDMDRLLSRARNRLDRPPWEAVHELGPACELPGALLSSFLILLEFPGSVEEALAANAMAGGDSASRGLLIGALTGAARGVEAVPGPWIEELSARVEIEQALESVGG